MSRHYEQRRTHVVPSAGESAEGRLERIDFSPESTKSSIFLMSVNRGKEPKKRRVAVL